jgi:hypothetical protein
LSWFGAAEKSAGTRDLHKVYQQRATPALRKHLAESAGFNAAKSWTMPNPCVASIQTLELADLDEATASR